MSGQRRMHINISTPSHARFLRIFLRVLFILRSGWELYVRDRIQCTLMRIWLRLKRRAGQTFNRRRGINNVMMHFFFFVFGFSNLILQRRRRIRAIFELRLSVVWVRRFSGQQSWTRSGRMYQVLTEHFKTVPSTMIHCCFTVQHWYDRERTKSATCIFTIHSEVDNRSAMYRISRRTVLYRPGNILKLKSPVVAKPVPEFNNLNPTIVFDRFCSNFDRPF